MSNLTRMIVEIGTTIQIRKIGSCGNFCPVKTTKPLTVPYTAARHGSSYTFDSLGYTVVVKEADVKTETLASPFCDRCNGRGYFSAYKHVQHGVCFKCGGHGFPNTVGAV